ncbi:MAG: ABC transporter permease [Bacteroidales bacterium]
MRDFLANLRYAFRQFRHAPVFTAAAVLTLSLGIGGTTAIFSLMHAVMLRSLPVADPAMLYRVGEGDNCCVEGGPQDRWGMYSYPLYLHLKENLPEFEAITAFQAGPDRMSVRRETERVAKPLRSEYVSGSYFATLGIRPYGGRLFSESDDTPSSAPVAVLSHRAWQSIYGGDASVVGSTFLIEGRAFSIVGVAPPGFFGETLRSDPPELWIPLQQEALIRGVDGSLLPQRIPAWLRVIGRLKPGANAAGLSARMTGLLRQWLVNDSGYPAEWMPEVKRLLPKQSINVIPAGAGVAEMKEEYGRSLQILLAVCGLVLLIACANVANLMLARAAARRAQTAMRLALGASRRQVVSQALIESVLLAVLGGIAGLGVAVAASRLLLALAFHSARYLPIDTAPSLPVLGFAFALSLLTGVIFGTAPAWFATRTDPLEALRGAGRSTRDRSSLARNTLLIAQAVLSIVLLASATMLARSLGNLESQDFGFDTRNRVMVTINPPSPTYSNERLNALSREMENRLRAVAGVEQVGLALYTPLTDNWGELVLVQGHPPSQLKEDSGSSWDRVSAQYFQAAGHQLLRGRLFTEADNENTAPVAVVNEAFVRRFLPGEEPLDKHFGLDLPENAGTFRIIGVMRDAKYTQPRRAARPMFFVPLAQYVNYAHPLMQKIEHQSHLVGGILLVTRTPVGVLEPAVTQALASLDPNLTVIRIRKLEEQVGLVFDQERAVASLAGVFAGMALLLAAIGLYGVMAYLVAQRTNDIGIRMALGADRSSVIRMVMSVAFRRVAIGLLLGVPFAVGAGRLLAAQLWGVKPWDPVALSLATLALGCCAFVAALIPALRAAAISPMDALRAE